MAQTASPTSDVTDGTWTDQGGGTVLYAAIDEASADDADFIKSADLTPGNSDACEVALGSVTDPASSADHLISYRYRAQGVELMNLTVSLMQGATTIATWTHLAVGSTFVTTTQTLSAGEADAITNYADLRLRFNATCGDITAPTITSSASVSVAENATLSHALTADETVTWSIIGGADQAQFEISGSTLRWASNGTQDYETPADANADNAYIVQVRATDTASNTADQTITVTVTDVSDGAGTAGEPIGLLLALTKAS